MNALCNQLRRTIEFHESQGRDTVEEIFLCGKVAMYKNLDKYLQNILGLKVTIWNPLANVTYNTKLFEDKKLKERAFMLALCSGLSCWRAFDIDLTSARKAEQRSKILSILLEYKALVYTTGIVFFSLFGLWILLFTQINVKESKKQQLLVENQKLDEIIKDIENLNQGRLVLGEHMVVAKTLLSHRLGWSKKLYEISKSVLEDMWLKEIYIKVITSSRTVRKNTAQLMPVIEAVASVEDSRPDLILIIKGVVYSEDSDDMLGVVNRFIGNLNSNEVLRNKLC